MEKKKILVVDDERDFVDIVKLRLESENFEVITAYDGAQALDRVAKDHPDAVLLDIMMPNLDGLSVLKRIRKQDKNLPVFMLTAFSNDERFKIADKFNASGFMVKTGDLKKEIDNINIALNIADKYKGQNK
ncbi:MAG: response regulator [Candidatus Omnitrophica bacterium]|nr:response regulator [Candidatus Omnitrophota bacterium]